jgi:hypothetical protein
MSFQAKIAGQWPTLFYYLYETNIQTDGERDCEKDGNSNTLTKGQGDSVDCDRSGGTLVWFLSRRKNSTETNRTYYSYYYYGNCTDQIVVCVSVASLKVVFLVLITV